jgi:hypothetical protein
MVSLAGAAGVAGVLGERGGEVVAGGELLRSDSEAVGKVTLSTPLLQPAVATTSRSVNQTRLFMANSYRIASGHAYDLAA